MEIPHFQSIENLEITYAVNAIIHPLEEEKIRISTFLNAHDGLLVTILMSCGVKTRILYSICCTENLQGHICTI